jgi:hypothetical protein
VLHIIVRVIEPTLKRYAGENSPAARIGAVSFIHRFGSALNAHVHFHLCVIEAVFAPGPDGAVQVHALHLPEAALAQAQQAIRRRVLSGFTRRGWLDETDRKDMLGWAGGGGFSLDGSVRIEAEDRAGLERVLRDCARPPFALERLETLGDGRLIYSLPKPRPDGQSALVLTPLELIDKLVALIPPPRQHRHRYHGALAPKSPLRAAVTALAPEPDSATAPQDPAAAPTPKFPQLDNRRHLGDFFSRLPHGIGSATRPKPPRPGPSSDRIGRCHGLGSPIRRGRGGLTVTRLAAIKLIRNSRYSSAPSQATHDGTAGRCDSKTGQISPRWLKPLAVPAPITRENPLQAIQAQ